MRRTRLLHLTALLTAAVLFAAGCAQRGAPEQPPAPDPAPAGDPAPAPADPPPAAPDAADLNAVSPAELEPEALAASLRRYVNQGEGTLAENLAALLERWQIHPGQDAVPFAEGDLDGDGAAETVIALNGAGPGIERVGDLFVIHGAPGGYAIDRATAVPLPHSSLLDLRNVRLHAVTDLDADGRPEIVWSTTSVGAHTAHSIVTVSTWGPGGLRHLPEAAAMANMRLRIEGSDLVLEGGIIGSVGAGAAQRPRTDTYRIADGRLVLADQRYAPSEYGYHRLIDGIVAESVGRKAEAERAYREAMEPDRTALPPAMLDPGGMAEPDLTERFDDAVRALARVRLTALLLEQDQPDAAAEVIAGAEGAYADLVQALAPAADRASACEAAAAHVRAHPDFLEALSAVFGYGNPRWREAGELCGPLPQQG